jgi:hypothetical protein
VFAYQTVRSFAFAWTSTLLWACKRSKAQSKEVEEFFINKGSIKRTPIPLTIFSVQIGMWEELTTKTALKQRSQRSTELIHF